MLNKLTYWNILCILLDCIYSICCWSRVICSGFCYEQVTSRLIRSNIKLDVALSSELSASELPAVVSCHACESYDTSKTCQYRKCVSDGCYESEKVMGWCLRRPAFNSRQRQEFFQWYITSTPAHWPTHPPSLWLHTDFSPEERLPHLTTCYPPTSSWRGA